MKRGTVIFLGMVFILFISSVAFSADESLLTWTGCGITKKAFMAEAAKAYEKETAGRVKIKISGGGATKGIRFANAELSDMGGTCRPSLPDKFPQEESKVLLTVVGWDALVPIVNKENPVETMRSDQLKQVMLGTITNWSELGGPDQKIQVVVRVGKISGVGFMARKIIFEDLEADYTSDAVVKKSSGPVEKYIEKNKWAIGITGISSAKKRSVKIVSVDGRAATVKNISSGAYPTFRPLYLATNGEPRGEVKNFLDWLVSEEGQAVVEQCGTVTLKQGAGLKAKFRHWLHSDHIRNFKSLL